MSGTSLDGLDLVLASFVFVDGKWEFSIEKANTITYPKVLIESLGSAIHAQQKDIDELDIDLGKFIGEAINDFLGQSAEADFIASHGHTIFHQPEKGLTLQIGNGEQISSITSLPVINNFRALDVSLGGQGAPLVPIGDRDLFSEYEYCLNLGGIANVSHDKDGQRVAYDICPFNMGLNELANELGLAFDDRGQLASKGTVDQNLLQDLNQISYLSLNAPKSLGMEDYQRFWQPLLKNSSISVEDRMSTLSEHVALQIASGISGNTDERVLITGGGAFHDHCINRIRSLTSVEVVIPDEHTINYKEALVFAYLGLLRLLDQPNCLASVTGASRDNSGGNLYNF